MGLGLKIIWNGKFVFPYFIEWFSLFTQKQNQSFLVLSVYYFKKFFVYAVVNFNLPTEQQGLTRNSMDFARYKIIYFPVDAMLSFTSSLIVLSLLFTCDVTLTLTLTLTLISLLLEGTIFVSNFVQFHVFFNLKSLINWWMGVYFIFSQSFLIVSKYKINCSENVNTLFILYWVSLY
jgi:hypothetical protein